MFKVLEEVRVEFNGEKILGLLSDLVLWWDYLELQLTLVAVYVFTTVVVILICKAMEVESTGN